MNKDLEQKFKSEPGKEWTLSALAQEVRLKPIDLTNEVLSAVRAGQVARIVGTNDDGKRESSYKWVGV